MSEDTKLEVDEKILEDVVGYYNLNIQKYHDKFIKEFKGELQSKFSSSIVESAKTEKSLLSFDVELKNTEFSPESLVLKKNDLLIYQQSCIAQVEIEFPDKFRVEIVFDIEILKNIIEYLVNDPINCVIYINDFDFIEAREVLTSAPITTVIAMIWLNVKEWKKLDKYSMARKITSESQKIANLKNETMELKELVASYAQETANHEKKIIEMKELEASYAQETANHEKKFIEMNDTLILLKFFIMIAEMRDYFI